MRNYLNSFDKSPVLSAGLNTISTPAIFAQEEQAETTRTTISSPCAALTTYTSTLLDGLKW